MTPSHAELALWIVAISDALPAQGVESRLALSCLVAEVTRLRTAAQVLRRCHSCQAVLFDGSELVGRHLYDCKRMVVVRSAEGK